jgi:hypothetical protein
LLIAYYFSQLRNAHHAHLLENALILPHDDHEIVMREQLPRGISRIEVE